MEKLIERIEHLKLKKSNLEKKSNDHDDDDDDDDDELSLNLANECFFEARALETEQSSIQKKKEIINNELRDGVKEKKNLDKQLIKLNTGYASLQRESKKVFKNGKKEMKQEFEAKFNLCSRTFSMDSELLKIKKNLSLMEKRHLEEDVAFGVKKQTEAQAQLNKLIAKDSELRSAKWTKTNFKSEKEEEQESLKHKFELFECKKVMLEGKLKLMRDLQQTPTYMLGQKLKEQIALYMIESTALNNDLDCLQQRNQQVEKEIREAIHEINRITWESANLTSSKKALETSNDEQESRQSERKEKINLIDNELRLIEWKQKYIEQTLEAYRKLGKIFDGESFLYSTSLSVRCFNSSALLGQDAVLES